RGSRQRDDTKDARAHAFGQSLDGPAFAGRVAPLEHDDGAQALELHPFLQMAELDLKLVQFLLVGFALEVTLGSLVFVNVRLHGAPRVGARRCRSVRPTSR